MRAFFSLIFLLSVLLHGPSVLATVTANNIRLGVCFPNSKNGLSSVLMHYGSEHVQGPLKKLTADLINTWIETGTFMSDSEFLYGDNNQNAVRFSPEFSRNGRVITVKWTSKITGDTRIVSLVTNVITKRSSAVKSNVSSISPVVIKGTYILPKNFKS